MPPADLLRLDWFRCLDGYRLEDRVDPPGRGALLLGSIAGRYIVRNSSKLESHKPLECVGLYRQLADVSDDDSALEFVTRHGSLERPKVKDTRLSVILDGARVMRRFVEMIDRKRWDILKDLLDRTGQDPDAKFQSGGLGRLGAVFDWREGMERPELHYRADGLWSAFSLQALQDASTGAELKKCDRPGCPEYFQVGPGTGRLRLNRGVAYCTPKCQKAHAYMKRKEP